MIVNSSDFVTIYEIRTTIDEWGRPGEIIGYSFDKAEAENFAKNKGWYGGNGKVVEKQTLKVETHFKEELWYIVDPIAIEREDFIDGIEEIKKRAIAKLSEKEKEVLGLS